MRLLAEPVFDLRDRGQEEAIPVLYDAPARREQASHHAARPRLAHVLRFDRSRAALHARAHLVTLAAAKQAAM
jgi:hypothetical protein